MFPAAAKTFCFEDPPCFSPVQHWLPTQHFSWWDANLHLGRADELQDLRSPPVCAQPAFPFVSASAIWWRRQWQPTPVLLPGESQERRSLAGCSPRGRTEMDTTERLHFHFSLSHIGEGIGSPLQCSCLENPRDGGAWWAAVCGVAQSRTRLKRLSSSGGSSAIFGHFASWF